MGLSNGLTSWIRLFNRLFYEIAETKTPQQVWRFDRQIVAIE